MDQRSLVLRLKDTELSALFNDVKPLMYFNCSPTKTFRVSKGCLCVRAQKTTHHLFDSYTHLVTHSVLSSSCRSLTFPHSLCCNALGRPQPPSDEHGGQVHGLRAETQTSPSQTKANLHPHKHNFLDTQTPTRKSRVPHLNLFVQQKQRPPNKSN